MKNSAEKHNNKIRALLLFIILTLATTYITVHTYEQLVDYRDNNELDFVITPKNTEFAESEVDKPWYIDTYNYVADFFSPTKTLVPILVIFPEDSERPEPSNGNSQSIKKEDINKAIAETSRDNPQQIDSSDRIGPKKVDEKPTSNTNSTGGSGSPGKHWNVRATDDDSPYGEGTNTAIADIFNSANNSHNKKIIYPGISGRYNFTIDNTKNDYNIWYSLIFSEKGTKVIPIIYRLKTKNGYLGEEDRWYSYDELSTLVHLEPMKRRDKVSYSLEWKWPEGINDNQYIKYGGEEYTLKITVYAESR